MPGPREFAHRYRYVLLALAVSFVVHAVVIFGSPSRPDSTPEADEVSLAVELVPLPEVVVPGPVARQPVPRPPRPRSPPRPAETIATLPPLATGTVNAVDSLPQLAEAPLLAPPADPQDSATEQTAKPEILAAAQPAAPVPALAPREFPVDALPPEVSIHYALSSVFADGRAQYSWSRHGDEYSITGQAEATGFFTLFLEGRITQESSGKVTGSGLRPERFIERKPQGPDEGLTFDWDHRTIEFRRNDEVKQASLADNTVDWLSMIFQLAHSPPKGDHVPLKVYTQRRIYEFELMVLGTEVLELPIGNVKALHLRHSTSDPKETVDVWLGIDQYYLPVKMRYPVARNRFFVDQVATSITSR